MTKLNEVFANKKAFIAFVVAGDPDFAACADNIVALAEAGAVEVYASCTHPVLSGPAMDNISQSAIRKLVVLDTIAIPEDRLIDKIELISTADLLAEAIIRIHEKRPLSPLFNS